MTPAHNLSEADLFRAWWDDGLLDLLCGMALLVTGLGWESRLGALAVVQAPLWIVLWAPLRRRLVEPRAGFVRFSLARRRRKTRSLWWSLLLGVALLAVFAALAVLARQRGAGPSLAQAVDGLPALLVAVAAVLAGLLTGARRFQTYALLLVAAAFLTVYFAAGPALPLVGVGAVAVGCGAVLLAWFLHSNRDFENGDGEETALP
jgi:hypothetical protein